MPSSSVEPVAPSAPHSNTLGETADLGEPIAGGEAGVPPPIAAIGRYTVIRRLGAGGMGTVYSAYDESLDRRVAIKVMTTSHESEQNRDRMLREARALARVSHPNVVQVFEVGELGDDLYLAMEYVRGRSLREWLADEHGVAELLDAFVQAGRGLAAVHGARLVHRDFKPDNVMVGEDGRVRLVDFGIARRADAIEPTAAPPEHVDADISVERLTRTGQFLGTPMFMSPEQLRGISVDARSDQFSFCVAVFRAVYRMQPFAGATMGALASNVFAGNLANPPRPPGVPAGLRVVLTRGLALDPRDRYADMDELLAAMIATLPGRAASRRRTPLALLGLAGLGSMAVVMLGTGGDDPCRGGEAALATVWSDARADQIAAGFASGSRPSAWAPARTELDARGKHWLAQYRDACERHRRGEQSAVLLDRRMACLERSKRELDALLTELADYDERLVDTVAEAVAALADPRTCGDANRLAVDGTGVPAPEIAAEVDELLAVVQRAQAQERAGRVARAHETLDAVRKEIDELAHPPLQCQAAMLAALMDQGEGRQRQAELEFQRAFEIAAAAGLDAETRESALSLANSIGVQQGRYTEAGAWVAIAEAWTKRLGDESFQRASVGEVVAGIDERAGRYPEAESRLRAALDDLAAEDGSEAVRLRASLYNELGLVYQRMERHDDAEAAFLRARESWLAFAGPDHPITTDPLNNLGSLYLAGNRLEDAERAWREALAQRERIFGHDHPKVAHVLHNLGQLADRRGDHEAAIVHYREALAILERELGPRDPAIALPISAIGEAYTQMGRIDEGLPYLERALAIDEAALGSTHPEVAWDLNAIATALARADRLQEARGPAERAVAIREAHGGDPRRTAQSRLILATILDALGERMRAREQAAVAMTEQRGHAPEQAEIQAWLDAHPAQLADARAPVRRAPPAASSNAPR